MTRPSDRQTNTFCEYWIQRKVREVTSLLGFLLTHNETTEVTKYLIIKENTSMSHFKESKEYLGDITEKERPLHAFSYQGSTEYSLATATFATLIWDLCRRKRILKHDKFYCWRFFPCSLQWVLLPGELFCQDLSALFDRLLHVPELERRTQHIISVPIIGHVDTGFFPNQTWTSFFPLLFF